MILNSGATPSQYGFVFGITNMAGFIAAPFFGRFGSRLGPKLLYNTGAFVQAIAGFSFGFLDYIDDTATFLGLSYALR
jgi:MFS family permease